MPLAILTRADVTEYARALAGWEVVGMPVTRTEAPRDPEALRRALAEPHDAVLVASARGAACVVGTSAEVWAAGPATAGLFANAHAAFDGASAARALLAHHGAGVRVLVPRAEDGREEAITILREGGAHVIEAIAYRTVLAADVDLAPLARADVVVLFAPSQVKALLTLANLVVPCVAIGATTAAALEARGFAPAVAGSPTPEGIAKAVASVYPPRR